MKLIRERPPLEITEALRARVAALIGAPNAKGCRMWRQSLRWNQGYGDIKVKGVHYGAHRIVWILANGYEPPPDLYVCHTCDTPGCVESTHLFLGTASENQQDALSKGRFPTGHRNTGGCRRLTDAQVLELRALHARGVDCAELGRRFGISRITAYYIAKARSRRFLEPAHDPEADGPCVP